MKVSIAELRGALMICTTPSAQFFGCIGPLQKSTIDQYVSKIKEYFGVVEDTAEVELDHVIDSSRIKTYISKTNRPDDYVTHLYTALKRVARIYNYHSWPMFVVVERDAKEHYQRVKSSVEEKNLFEEKEVESIDEFTAARGLVGTLEKLREELKNYEKGDKGWFVRQRSIVLCLLAQELSLRANDIRLLQTTEVENPPESTNTVNMITGVVNIRVQKQAAGKRVKAALQLRVRLLFATGYI